MGKKIISVRLDEVLLSAVDELCPKRGDRSDFISDAISEKLRGGDGDLPLEAEERVGEKPRPGKRETIAGAVGLNPDEAVLREVLLRKRMTSRQAEAETGWFGLRYSKAERALMDLGLVRVEGGVLCACDPYG